jgi:hypothetical protein
VDRATEAVPSVLLAKTSVRPDHWRPIPDYEEEPEARLFAASDLPGPGDVDPTTIDPI